MFNITLKYFLALLPILFLLDFTAISLLFKKQYQKTLIHFQKSTFQFRIIPALLFYLLLSFGITTFVFPLIRNNHWISDSFFYGGLFGLVVYGFYSLTVYALLEKWPINLVIIDIVWGTVFVGFSTYIVQWIMRNI